MSAAAELFVVPVSLLSELAAAAQSGSAAYLQALDRAARVKATFDYTGYALTTLLPVLQTEYGIDMMESYPMQAQQLSASTGTFHNVFAHEASRALAGRLNPASFSSATLERQFEEFNADAAPGVGEVMLAGISFLRAGMQQIEADELGLLVIG